MLILSISLYLGAILLAIFISLLSWGGSGHFAVECDVSSPQSVESCYAAALAQLSRPPTLLTNAAGITMDCFIKKMTPEQFDKVLQVNLKVSLVLVWSYMKIFDEYDINNFSHSVANMLHFINSKSS